MHEGTVARITRGAHTCVEKHASPKLEKPITSALSYRKRHGAKLIPEMQEHSANDEKTTLQTHTSVNALPTLLFMGSMYTSFWGMLL